MKTKTGRYVLIEQFLADGMDYMFGNPGTVEQGFLDVLSEYPRMKYILTLQESVAVMMADGYARAVKKPALVQIHSTPGLGNAVGALYQAMRGHSPLVVIGGDAGIKYLPMDAQMAGDLVAMAKPVTKWSVMVQDSASLLRTIRRAVKIAATPPMGPVYVCLPADILDQPAVESVYPASIPTTRVIPERFALEQAAEWLAGAENPMIFIGDGVAYSGAQEETARVAEQLGAEVWGVDSGELNISYNHPLYQGQTGHMFGFGSYSATSKGDVNLIVGTYMVPEVFPRLDDIYASGAKTIHIDLNAYEIAKNHPVDLGMVSDPRATLSALGGVLEGMMTSGQKKAALERKEKLAAEKEKKRAAQIDADSKNPSVKTLFMKVLSEKLPADAVIFDNRHP